MKEAVAKARVSRFLPCEMPRAGRRVGGGLVMRGRRRATAPAASLLWGQDDVLELVVVAAESVITLGTTESYTFKGEFCGV